MKKQHSQMRHFMRGGQTLMHTMRMVNQITNRIGLFFLVFFVLFTFGMTYVSMTDYQLYLLRSFLMAKFYLVFNPNTLQHFLDETGHLSSVHSKAIVESPYVLQQVHTVYSLFLRYLITASVLSAIGIFFAYRFLSRRGRTQAETQALRGDEIVSLSTAKRRILKSNNVSNISLAGLPMPARFECQHMLVHGTTGSGKSVCIRELLDQIRERGDRAIIYDKSCSYVQSYYNTATDIILNPLDDRGAAWHLWNECRDAADYDSLATGLMPTPIGASDPFWVSSARLIFAAAARQMSRDSDRSMQHLLDILLSSDLKAMQSFLKGTEARNLVSEKVEKMALSIQSVLITYLKNLRYIKDEGRRDSNAFSIRQWIQDDTQSNWLFVSSLSDRHESLKPLMSMWLDLAANSLMSLSPSESRRIWIILDELPTLQRLPYLTDCFAESRKFGGCLVAGVQSISQLRKIYGNHAAEEISGLCNTRIFFREPSFDTAQWVSRELGATEIEEVKEGMSYGENAMRAGISMSSQQSNRLLVHPSEIVKLNNLEAYIRLPGQLPITKLKFEYKKREPVANAYVPCAAPPVNTINTKKSKEENKKNTTQKNSTPNKEAQKSLVKRKMQRRVSSLENELTV